MRLQLEPHCRPHWGANSTPPDLHSEFGGEKELGKGKRGKGRRGEWKVRKGVEILAMSLLHLPRFCIDL